MNKIIWWGVALLVGVPLTLFVLARIIMITIYLLPLFLVGAIAFGVIRVLVFRH